MICFYLDVFLGADALVTYFYQHSFADRSLAKPSFCGDAAWPSSIFPVVGSATERTEWIEFYRQAEGSFDVMIATQPLQRLLKQSLRKRSDQFFNAPEVVFHRAAKVAFMDSQMTLGFEGFEDFLQTAPEKAIRNYTLQLLGMVKGRQIGGTDPQLHMLLRSYAARFWPFFSEKVNPLVYVVASAPPKLYTTFQKAFGETFKCSAAEGTLSDVDFLCKLLRHLYRDSFPDDYALPWLDSDEKVMQRLQPGAKYPLWKPETPPGFIAKLL